MMSAQEDVSKFANTYIPKDYPGFIQCCLKREKSGVQGGFFPTFFLQMERPNDGKKVILDPVKTHTSSFRFFFTKIFLLAARKVAKMNRQSEYIITTAIEALSDKSASQDYIGTLRGQNLAGTEYILYDNGISPKKFSHKHGDNRENLRRELAAVIYVSFLSNICACQISPSVDFRIQIY